MEIRQHALVGVAAASGRNRVVWRQRRCQSGGRDYFWGLFLEPERELAGGQAVQADRHEPVPVRLRTQPRRPRRRRGQRRRVTITIARIVLQRVT